MMPNFFESPFNSIDPQQFEMFNSNRVDQQIPPKNQNQNPLIDEDEADEDYNYNEDLVNNEKIYLKDNDPSQFRISKKEYTDLIKEKEISQIEIENNHKVSRRNKNLSILENKNECSENENLESKNQINYEYIRPDDYTFRNYYRGPSIYHSNSISKYLLNPPINIRNNTPNYSQPLSNTQMRQIIKQRDIYIQLLIQCLMLTTSTDEKAQAYTMLYNITERFCRFTSEKKFDIPFSFLNKSILQVNVQISIFQSPLIDLVLQMKEFLPTKSFTANELRILLKNCDYIDKKLLPIVENSTCKAARKIFSNIDDHLLLIGLEEYGCKNFDEIQKNWLYYRSKNEIMNRYKNLTCTKAETNIIKEWKRRCMSNLSNEELNRLKEGVEWFGSNKRWQMISKLFVPSRNPLFLEKKYNQIISACPQIEILKDYSEWIKKVHNNQDITIYSIPDFIKIDFNEGRNALEWEKLDVSKELPHNEIIHIIQ